MTDHTHQIEIDLDKDADYKLATMVISYDEDPDTLIAEMIRHCYNNKFCGFDKHMQHGRLHNEQ